MLPQALLLSSLWQAAGKRCSSTHWSIPQQAGRMSLSHMLGWVWLLSAHEFEEGVVESDGELGSGGAWVLG